MSSLVFLPAALCWWALKKNNNNNCLLGRSKAGCASSARRPAQWQWQRLSAAAEDRRRRRAEPPPCRAERTARNGDDAKYFAVVILLASPSSADWHGPRCAARTTIASGSASYYWVFHSVERSRETAAMSKRWVRCRVSFLILNKNKPFQPRLPFIFQEWFHGLIPVQFLEHIRFCSIFLLYSLFFFVR